MEHIAKSIPKLRRIEGTGLESLLDLASVFTLIAGLLASLFALYLHGWAGLLMLLLIVTAAVFNWLLLRSLAELIRLQKRIAGLEYSGRVSGAHHDTVASCSSCGNMLHSDVCCDVCGARIVKPEDDGQAEAGE